MFDDMTDQAGNAKAVTEMLTASERERLGYIAAQQAAADIEAVEKDLDVNRIKINRKYAAMRQQEAQMQINRIRRPTMKDNLQEQLAHHQSEVARLQKLISLLEANPDTQMILDLMKG